MKWICQEAGSYYDESERFEVDRVYTNMSGIHWRLKDNKLNEIHKHDSLKQCKNIAENIIEEENKRQQD